MYEKFKQRRAQLEHDLEKLKKSCTELSEEDLKGKYRKAFYRLKENIMHQTVDYIYFSIVQTLPIIKEDENEYLIPLFISLCNERKDDMKEIMLKEKDLDKLDEWILTVFLKDAMQRHRAYFNAHSFLTENGRIFNTLLEMFWNPELSVWESVRGGWVQFTMRYPFDGECGNFSNPYAVFYKDGKLQEVS